LIEGSSIPLAVVRSGANRMDMKKRGDLLDAQVIEAVPEAGAEAMIAERERRGISAWIGAMRRWRAGRRR